MTGLTAGTAAAIGKQVLAEMVQRLKDDIFSSYLEEIVVAADGSFNQAKLKLQTQTFRAPGCTYTVTYRWAARVLLSRTFATVDDFEAASDR